MNKEDIDRIKDLNRISGDYDYRPVVDQLIGCIEKLEREIALLRIEKLGADAITKDRVR